MSAIEVAVDELVAKKQSEEASAVAAAEALLPDSTWGFLRLFVSGNCPWPLKGRPANHRNAMRAILWAANNAIDWRKIPSELGNWNSIHRQWKRWKSAGIWKDILLVLETGTTPNKNRYLIEWSENRPVVEQFVGDQQLMELIRKIEARKRPPSQKRKKSLLPYYSGSLADYFG